MKITLTIISVLLFLAGILAGLYVGIYEGWFKGIVGVIESSKQTPVASAGIAWGIVRIIFASFAGTMTAWFFWMAAALFGALSKDLRRY